MNAWLAYAIGAALLLAGGILVASFFLSDRDVTSLWLAGGIAYAVQLLAFAVLVRARGRNERAFLLSWAGGIGLRFLTVLSLAMWARNAYASAATLLIGLVAMMFVLVLLEPLFMRIVE
jgi:hypothetical protein